MTEWGTPENVLKLKENIDQNVSKVVTDVMHKWATEITKTIEYEVTRLEQRIKILEDNL